MKDGRAQLEYANNYVQEVLSKYSDCTDGQTALQRALRAETLALQDFGLMLRVFDLLNS